MKVRELMTTSLLTLNEHDSMQHARQLMKQHRIRHLPVIDDDSRFIGLLTLRDLLSATVSRLAEIDAGEIESFEATVQVGDVMNVEIIAVDAETDLREAALCLIEHKFGCLPVLRDGYLIGILTESDFVRLVADMLEQEEA
ncbi:MAG TPA: CBS domain-containing protein [Gammaproteobacteria bacterium]